MDICSEPIILVLSGTARRVHVIVIVVEFIWCQGVRAGLSGKKSPASALPKVGTFASSAVTCSEAPRQMLAALYSEAQLSACVFVAVACCGMNELELRRLKGTTE